MQTTTNLTETLKLNRYTVTVTHYEPTYGNPRSQTMTLAAVNSADVTEYGYRMLDQSVRSVCKVTVSVYSADRVWIKDRHFQPTVQSH